MTRTAPAHIDAATFRDLGHRLVDHVAGLLESLPSRPVARLPQAGLDPALLLEQTAPLLFDHSLFNAHPRFFGYITSSPAPIGILGELLAAALNPNVGAWRLSPAATEI